MAQSRDVQYLEEHLKYGCQLIKDVETKLNSPTRGPDFLNFIWNHSAEIVSRFVRVLGMMGPNSNLCCDDNCQGIENPLKKDSGAIKKGHSQRNSVKDNRNSCSQCRGRSSCPRSRGQSSLDCSRPNNMSEGFVPRSWSTSGKLKCDKLADSLENLCTCKEKKQAISRKRKATGEWTHLMVEHSSETGNHTPPDGFTWPKYGQKVIVGDEHPRVYYDCTYKRDRGCMAKKKTQRKATGEWTHLMVEQSSETGNHTPPDDFTWRKYGQKVIAGDEHPRVYYECTYKRDRGCMAKKKTQRSSDNPSLFDVWLSGDHTCQQINLFDPHPLSEIRSSNTNPKSITPTTLIVGTDSNLQPNITSAGNTIYAGNFLISGSPPPWSAADDFGVLQEQIQGFTGFENCLSDSLYVDSSAHSPMQFTCPSADQGYNNLQGS